MPDSRKTLPDVRPLQPDPPLASHENAIREHVRSFTNPMPMTAQQPFGWARLVEVEDGNKNEQSPPRIKLRPVVEVGEDGTSESYDGRMIPYRVVEPDGSRDFWAYPPPELQDTMQAGQDESELTPTQIVDYWGATGRAQDFYTEPSSGAGDQLYPWYVQNGRHVLGLSMPALVWAKVQTVSDGARDDLDAATTTQEMMDARPYLQVRRMKWSAAAVDNYNAPFHAVSYETLDIRAYPDPALYGALTIPKDSDPFDFDDEDYGGRSPLSSFYTAGDLVELVNLQGRIVARYPHARWD